MECKLTHEELLKAHPELLPLMLDSKAGHWWWTDYRDSKDRAYVGRGANRRFVMDVIFEAIENPVPVGFTPTPLCGSKKCQNPAHLEFQITPPRRYGPGKRRIFINGRPQVRQDEHYKLTYEEFIAKVQAEGHDIAVDIEPWLREMTPMQRFEALKADGLPWFLPPRPAR